MRIRIAAFTDAVLLTMALASLAPFASAQQWTLPPSKPVKDDGPRVYRFTVEYTTTSTKGDIVRRQRLTAEYIRGLPAGDVMWKNVTQADVDDPTAPFGPGQKRDFMEGFRYRNDLSATLEPDFFEVLLAELLDHAGVPDEITLKDCCGRKSLEKVRFQGGA